MRSEGLRTSFSSLSMPSATWNGVRSEMPSIDSATAVYLPGWQIVQFEAASVVGGGGGSGSVADVFEGDLDAALELSLLGDHGTVDSECRQRQIEPCARLA